MTRFSSKVINWFSGIVSHLKDGSAFHKRYWIPNWSTFLTIIGLLVSIVSCHSTSKENELLRREVVSLKGETHCRFDKVDDSLTYIKGKMLPNDCYNSVIDMSDEREKNTMLALKRFDEGDYESAYRYAKRGNIDNPDILFMLGWLYYEGNGVDRSLEDSFRCWNKAAQSGHMRAQFDLAVMYAKGEYVKQDYSKSIKYLTMAAEAGLPIAAFHLGLVYEKGTGVKKNGRKAIEWYERAYASGCVHAGYHIANMYATGQCVERNRDAAREWFEKVAAKKDANAMAHVAMNVPLEVDDNNDIKTTSRLYDLAKEGVFVAVFRIVNAYEYGICADIDIDKAYKWCVEAAEKGSEMFQLRAGDMCLTGKIHGKGEEDAYRWYRMAANSKAAPAEAYYKLACLYASGRGVPKDETKAFKLFMKADEENDGYDDAQVAIGDAYCHGAGVAKDIEEALRWYLKAAEAENAVAFLRLGGLYERGCGVPKDIKMALEYFEKAKEAAFEETIEEEASKGLIRLRGRKSITNQNVTQP